MYEYTQGIESLFGNVLGGIGGINGDTGEQVKKSLGGLLKGFLVLAKSNPSIFCSDAGVIILYILILMLCISS